MKVKIIETETNKVLNASILSKDNLSVNLPSFTDGWRFNFFKHSAGKRFKTFALVSEITPNIIEGCLIFELRKNVEPFMAFVEIAPHNRGNNKEKSNVAESLIAFACRLSFIHGKGVYQGWLAFDVLEERKEDEIKLMAMYSVKYYALKFSETTMVIPPVGGEKLINEFLIK